MKELIIPNITLESVSLKPEKTDLKKRVEKPNDLNDAIKIGKPICMTLDENIIDDPDLKILLKNELDKADYYIVYMACSFKPPVDHHFINAWFTVDLNESNLSEDKAPIAWSMMPEKLSSTEEITQKIGVDSKLKIFSLGVEQEITSKKDEVHVEASGFLDTLAEWEINETSNRPISNAYKFELVVRVPSGIKAKGEISLTASIEKKSFMPWTYKADIDAQSRLIDIG